MDELYQPGTQIWVQDEEEGWLLATIQKAERNEKHKIQSIQVIDEDDKTITLDYSKPDAGNLPPLKNPEVLEGIDDLTSLSYLHEPAVLYNVKLRYAEQIIYTYSGIVLVAVNPFAKVALYSPDVARAYSGKRRGELEPHLFAVAEDAYRCMVREGKNQSIIVSGESGAGKTVSAKYIMRYFAAVGSFDGPDHPSHNNVVDDTMADGWEARGVSEVEEQVLATNPIMEAFGNAKTTRNDNSSRFGKYIEIQFNAKNDIVGASMRTYLLERSRVVFQPEIERNYHIFYQLCAGAPSAERKELCLNSYDSFSYLRQGGQGVIQGVDDAEEFTQTTKALSTIGISVSMQWKIFRILAAVLHLGNIEIKSSGENCSIPEQDDASTTVARLLGVPLTDFRKWIVKKQITLRSETILTDLKLPQAIASRDAVSKYIYNALFEWLIRVVNDSLSQKDLAQVKSFIGVLDIYGFEHFKKNSFEQFCINYANEKLQQEFNQHVFKLEQEEYVREKINWSFINFNDNKPCIDLIESKLGILDLLDEESRLPSGSDASFTTKLMKQFATPPKQHAYFAKPRFSNAAFTVNHYAHSVVYDTDGFLEKNKDTMSEEILSLLQGSDFDFCKELFNSQNTGKTDTAKSQEKPDGPSRKGPSRSTLGSAFKISLQRLMETINATNVHYIRCIKPNEAKKAFVFDNVYVLHQLRACGILETIRISCAGYPSRFGFEEFADRYRMLSKKSPNTKDPKTLAIAVLETVVKNEDQYQIGTSKIFLRAGQLAVIEKHRSDVLNKAMIAVQKEVRRFLCQTRYKQMRQSAIKIQTILRAHQARKMVQTRREARAAIRIQKIYRGHRCKKQYRQTRQAVITLQALARGRAARKVYQNRRQVMAAIKIQKTARGHLARRSCRAQKKKVVLTQACVRRYLARKELKQLRIEARSVNHFQEKAGALERKLFEFSQLLSSKEKETDELRSKLSHAEHQIQVLREKSEKSETKRAEGESKTTSQLQSFKEQLSELKKRNAMLEQQKISDVVAIQNKDQELECLRKDVALLKRELANSTHATTQPNESKDDQDRIATLLAENAQLKDKIAKAVFHRGRPGEKSMSGNSSEEFKIPLGRNSFHEYTPSSVASPLTTRTPRRHQRFSESVEPVTSPKEAKSPTRPLTTIFYETSDIINNTSPEIMSYLLDTAVDFEVANTLIKGIVIPELSEAMLPRREVLFPAHIIGQAVLSCWKNSLTDRVKSLLTNSIRSIHDAIAYDDNNGCCFWLANVFELNSIIRTAQEERNLSKNKRRLSGGSDTERVITKYCNDLEYLIIEIYYNWMKELKKSLGTLIVSAVIEHQGLPGFIDDTTKTSGFLNKWMTSSSQSVAAASTEKLLSWFSKLHHTMQYYYLEEGIKRQALTSLIKNMGTNAFNHLIMKKNFCSWRRGMQIQYNVTRIEEWCTLHDISEAALHLEPLMQATKLLQLNKTSTEDVEIMFDVCFLLSATQIKKLLGLYHTAEFENPITADILKAVASRCLDERDSVFLLDTNDDTPFSCPPPSVIDAVDCFIPPSIESKIPALKRICGL